MTLTIQCLTSMPPTQALRRLEVELGWRRTHDTPAEVARIRAARAP